ncbi:esterase/lipase family protein [Corynebacterium qintianiae]|uniref:esterase/lipase family protein n=1 Tax=Corynebacterium qintianiae TaxID=2709392 RepID=UPI001F2E2970|nr:lipase family protein [Corynebacterium qintianiae]
MTTLNTLATRCARVAVAAVIALATLASPAHAQEVPNGSSPLLGSSTVHDLDAHAMGDYVPPQAELDAAFGCSNPVADPAAKKTVLLVHGVGANAQQTFAWNYIPQLDAEGFDVCWVNLPHNGRGDLTQAGLYVANAVKLAHSRVGRNIGVVGHSAGPPAAMWGLRYDAEATTLVDDFVSVAGAIRGTTLVEPLCLALGNCPAIAWQMHPQSNFVQALNAEPLAETIDVTSVYSLTDYGIQPATQASYIAGAANIPTQRLCPTQIPGHIGILANNTAYQLVLDALNHDGPADPARLKGLACSQHISPGIDPRALPVAIPAIGEYVAALGEPRYLSEPALPSYARADVAAPLDPTQMRSGSSQRLAEGSATYSSGVIGSAAGSSSL